MSDPRTRPTKLGAGLKMPDVWRGSHWSTGAGVTRISWPWIAGSDARSPDFQADALPLDALPLGHRRGRLTTWPSGRKPYHLAIEAGALPLGHRGGRLTTWPSRRTPCHLAPYQLAIEAGALPLGALPVGHRGGRLSTWPSRRTPYHLTPYHLAIEAGK